MQPLQLGHCPTLPRWYAEATWFPSAADSPKPKAHSDLRLEYQVAGYQLRTSLVRALSPLSRERDRTRSLDSALGGVDGYADDLQLTFTFDRVLTRAGALASDLSSAGKLASASELTGYRFMRHHARAEHLVLVSLLKRTLDRDLDLADVLTRGLQEAHSNLSDAANNFTGADLTGVDLDRVDLAWLRWDADTQWPSREWAERMRRASAEHPPGTGIFTVLPEAERDPAQSTLV